MSIKNYTSQTNSHEGYTIEELRRLFGDGKQITSENFIKLINQCFNYELVSGNGIRIIELKNNDFRNNTTKTYKLECTHKEGSGGSGSGVDINTDKGITFDIDRTVIADLYDYEESGNPEQDGVYPVSLSEDGKLVVNMTTNNLIINKTSIFSYHEFENNDIIDNFSFTVTLVGSNISVYKIETWVDDNGNITDLSIYDDTHNADYINDLNTSKIKTFTKNCSARVNQSDPTSAVTRTGKIKVYYKIKNTNYTKVESVSTKFTHKIYYGYTCDYSVTDTSHIAPERFNENPGIISQPCFKVYSPNDSDYIDGDHLTGKRTGIELTRSGNNCDVKIKNTEKNINYVLGYYDMTSSQEGKHTLSYLPTSRTFNLTGLGDHSGKKSVFVAFLIPKSMVEITRMTSSIDGGTANSILEGMMVESAVIKDYAYYNDGLTYNNIEYIVYTQKKSFSTVVSTNINVECTVSVL